MQHSATTRYDPVAVTLHWVMALLILLMIPMGFFMEDVPSALKGDVYGIHKSVGLTVLGLSLFRLIWRLLNPPPALPANLKPIERLLARMSHWGFYVLMVGMPLSGWLMVSASQKFPTVFFWSFEVPFLPLPELADKKETAHMFKEYHETLAYGTLALLTLHIGAALKHRFILRDDVLARMLPKHCARKSS